MVFAAKRLNDKSLNGERRGDEAKGGVDDVLGEFLEFDCSAAPRADLEVC